MTKHAWLAALSVLLLCAAPAAPLLAQDYRDSVPSIDVVRNRLVLTPGQEAKLAPLFQQRALDLQHTRAKLEQALSQAERRGVLRAARSEAQAFNRQVESVLDTQQKSEWRQIRDETREKVKERHEREHESQ